jgi:hypothetical protein
LPPNVAEVPILLQNDFAHLGAQDRFNIRRQCAMLIQKSMRLDSIVSNFYSTVSPRRLLQQNLPDSDIAVSLSDHLFDRSACAPQPRAARLL